MLAAGLTPEQIMQNVTKDINMGDDEADEAQEIEFDPSKLNLDQNLRDEYAKLM